MRDRDGNDEMKGQGVEDIYRKKAGRITPKTSKLREKSVRMGEKQAASEKSQI